MKTHSSYYSTPAVLWTMLFFAILAFGCKQTNSENATLPETDKTVSQAADASRQPSADLMAPFAPQPQTFTVSSKQKSVVKGKQGTQIFVDPKALRMPDGSAVAGNIQVNLIECVDKSSLLAANLQTVSNGRLLESGGSYYIDMQADGQALTLAQGERLPVSFPKLSKKPMELFYGERNEAGQMNWEAAEQPFNNPSKVSKTTEAGLDSSDIMLAIAYAMSMDGNPVPDSAVNVWEGTNAIMDEFGSADPNSNTADEVELYRKLNLDRFGWINCDRFEQSKKMEQLVVKLPGNRLSSTIYYVFENENSLMCDYIYYDQQQITSTSMPVGQRVTVIAIGRVNDQFHFAESKATIGQTEPITLNPKVKTVEEIGARLAKL